VGRRRRGREACLTPEFKRRRRGRRRDGEGIRMRGGEEEGEGGVGCRGAVMAWCGVVSVCGHCHCGIVCYGQWKWQRGRCSSHLSMATYLFRAQPRGDRPAAAAARPRACRLPSLGGGRTRKGPGPFPGPGPRRRPAARYFRAAAFRLGALRLAVALRLAPAAAFRPAAAMASSRAAMAR